jgi:hypothetical protein
MNSFKDDEFICRTAIGISVVTKSCRFTGYVNGNFENIIRVRLFLLQHFETLRETFETFRSVNPDFRRFPLWLVQAEANLATSPRLEPDSWSLPPWLVQVEANLAASHEHLNEATTGTSSAAWT